jgi:hypothetical protein
LDPERTFTVRLKSSYRSRIEREEEWSSSVITTAKPNTISATLSFCSAAPMFIRTIRFIQQRVDHFGVHPGGG